MRNEKGGTWPLTCDDSNRGSYFGATPDVLHEYRHKYFLVNIKRKRLCCLLSAYKNKNARPRQRNRPDGAG